MIPVCPSLACFLKLLCLMFVYFLFYVGFVSGLILWFLDDLWFDDLCAQQLGDRLKFVLALM